jgi:hypothetical protein
MRRSLHAISISITIAFLFGLAGLLGCSKKKESSAGKQAEGSKAAEVDKTDKADKAAGPAGMIAEAKRNALADRFRAGGLTARLGLEPITVEEVQPLIPTLTGATPIGAPSTTGGGRRVTAIQCVDGSDMEKIKAELERKLTDSGFTSIRASALGKLAILNISAQKTPYRLSASVRSGPFPDCPAEQKKLKVLTSFFKRPAAPPTAPAAAASPR